jgi:response regulator RpfG family c-di-GMP phosphodiesterase
MALAQPIKYNAIIADPDVQTRMRLKQATASVVQFGEVVQVTTLSEAGGRIQSDRHWDVVFISNNFSEGEVTDFIARAKEHKGGQDAAFIRVLKSKDQQNSAVAQGMLQGIDGFLFEPYSVDQLVDITTLSARIKKERSDTRQRLAIELLLSDVMKQLDLVAFLKSVGFEVTRSATRLKEMCNALQGASTGQMLEVYKEVAVKLFSEAPLPKPMFQAKQYSGVSARVKKKMEEKIIQEVEKELSSSNAKF